MFPVIYKNNCRIKDFNVNTSEYLHQHYKNSNMTHGHEISVRHMQRPH